MPSRNFLCSFCPSWYKWVTFFAQFDFTSVQHKHNTAPWDSQFEQVMLCSRTFFSGRFLAKALDIVWNPLYSSQNASGILYCGSVSVWAWTIHCGSGYPVHHKMLEASRGNKTSSLPLWLYGRDDAGSNSYKHKDTNLRSLSYKLVHIFSIKSQDLECDNWDKSLKPLSTEIRTTWPPGRHLSCRVTPHWQHDKVASLSISGDHI